MEQKNPIVAAIEALGEKISQYQEEMQRMQIYLDGANAKASMLETQLNETKAENERLTRKLNEVKDYIKAQEEA